MSFKKLSAVLIGTESLLVQSAEIWLQRGHEIKSVISGESFILDWAQKKGIPQIDPSKGLKSISNQVASLAPFDYLLSITNLTIIPDELLALPAMGAINFHDGPLPRYAGLHATSWALLNREQMHGITWHRIAGGVDEGQILKQRPVPIVAGETAFTLNAKCYEAGIESFAELVDELTNGSVQPQVQDLNQKSYFGKYQRPDAACAIPWNQPAGDIDALVRALDFGPYANPLGLPKVAIGDTFFIVPKIDVIDARPMNSPIDAGTVTHVNGGSVTVATAQNQIILRELRTLDNQPLDLTQFIQKFGVQAGDKFHVFDEEATARLTQLNQDICRHEAYWLQRLTDIQPLEIPYANRSAAQATADDVETTYAAAPLSLTDAQIEAVDGALIPAFATYLARLSGTYQFDMGFSDVALKDRLHGFETLFAQHLPLRVALGPDAPFQQAKVSVETALASTQTHLSYAQDVFQRYPDLGTRYEAANSYAVVVEEVASLDDLNRYAPPTGSELILLTTQEGTASRWLYDTQVFTAAHIADMQRQFATFLENIGQNGETSVAHQSLLGVAESQQMMVDWNATEADYPRDLCLHQLFEAQVARTPDAVAVVFEDQQLSYRELNERANQLAHHLQALGVGPETLVGIYMERSLDLMVALFGTLKAGGAYVPLDPTYPPDRIAFMVADSQIPVLLTQERLRDELPPHAAHVVQVDADWQDISYEATDNVVSGVTPDNLSYVIYTSGSTGKPKGVMVCHGNVVNFFRGMDDPIPHDPPGVWLAVTSLSFDISVLELFWTLARGFKVVLYADKHRAQSAQKPASPYAQREIDFSLFYFASDEGEDAESKAESATSKYDLLLEGAKFADRNGFSAVWTPERHFHAFGGLYPNPSVASAAIAAITKNVGIRAGSCVLPLHHPIRVAEDWALVDNISNGRVGISFAAGWQPNDFVLRPENHADRKEIMFQDIEVVRKLWRGETLKFPGVRGDEVEVRTLPRPVQKELPVWVTAAGNPETFRMAGEGGFHILTHLLGQDIQELAEKLVVYRAGWAKSGRAGNGHVTLMLHTLVGDDVAAVKEIVRKPMTDYLRSAVGLIRQAAWSFPTFKQRAEETGKSPLEMLEGDDVSAEDMEALLNFAFERYFENSGLFGTPESCLDMVNALKGIDVDEIACLIDFGVHSKLVMSHLKQLNQLRQLADPTQDSDEYSIPNLIERHQVTHFQCTPSMASMLTLDPLSRDALGKLQTMMVGGEAMPVALAEKLTELTSGDVINMYGPTETTIWSSTYQVEAVDATQQHAISIGRPIANTQLYIVDEHLQPVPIGLPGELLIGGDGVVRGYLHRPELTAERFIDGAPLLNPATQLSTTQSSATRLYRTGDLARYLPNGNIEFLGRNDFQVKLRGYRIELGEIETLLSQHPTIHEAVVIAREDTPGNKQLVAYLIYNTHKRPSNSELRHFCLEKIPDFMVPAAFVPMDAFPLTPNGKVNRRALPAPDQARPALEKAFLSPRNAVEEAVVDTWLGTLGMEQIGINDNFFELGGHSLLAVQLITQIRETFMVNLPLHSLFEAPTVAGLSEVLVASETKPGQTEKIAQILKRVKAMSATEVGDALQKRGTG